MLVYDIARIYKEDAKQTASRIERGREKIKHWLRLVNFLETVPEKGCDKCGKANCSNAKNCASRRSEILELKEKLPLENLLEMSIFRWYAAVVFVAEHHTLNTIKI